MAQGVGLHSPVWASQRGNIVVRRGFPAAVFTFFSSTSAIITVLPSQNAPEYIGVEVRVKRPPHLPFRGLASIVFTRFLSAQTIRCTARTRKLRLPQIVSWTTCLCHAQCCAGRQSIGSLRSCTVLIYRSCLRSMTR